MYRAAWGVKSWRRIVSLKELGFIVEVRFKHTHLAAGPEPGRRPTGKSQGCGDSEGPRARGAGRSGWCQRGFGKAQVTLRTPSVIDGALVLPAAL